MRKVVKTKKEVTQLCGELEGLYTRLERREYDHIDDDLYELVLPFQNVKSDEIFDLLNNYGIPKLIKILKLFEIHKKEINSEDYYTHSDMMILKILAYYPYHEANRMILHAIRKGYSPENYLWAIIFGVIAQYETKYCFFIETLADEVPEGFIGIAYLDMLNELAAGNYIREYPLNTQRGYEYLTRLFLSKKPEEYSYAASAAAALPFLKEEYFCELIELAVKHVFIDVVLVAAWAGSKRNYADYEARLVEFARDYRYSRRAMIYLEELGKDFLIPKETEDPDFQALAIMSDWLAQPDEFGCFPDEEKIIDKRRIYWPPAKQEKQLYIIRYTYKEYNENGSDRIGIGLVGAQTFSLYGIKGIFTMTPEEIYALYCGWEMGLEGYETVKPGWKKLKKKNKEFQTKYEKRE